MPLIKKRLALALAAVSTAAAVGAPAASAATADPTACTDQTFTQIFLAFGDSAYYTPVPDAGFESAEPGWQLAGGAVVVTDLVDNRPLDGQADLQAVRLPEGASATTAPMCVTDAHRTLRFFSRGAGDLLTASGTVRVEMITEVDGVRKVELLKDQTPGLTWGLGAILKLDTKFYEIAKDAQTSSVQFRISAVGGAVEVDDVFVDPRMV